jgi:type IV secretory pathway VirB10-like protein
MGFNPMTRSAGKS